MTAVTAVTADLSAVRRARDPHLSPDTPADASEVSPTRDLRDAPRPAGRFEARIGIAGNKHVYLGLFNEEADAARAYDAAVVRIKGSHASTNFSLSDYARELAEHELKQVPAPARSARTQSVLTGAHPLQSLPTQTFGTALDFLFCSQECLFHTDIPGSCGPVWCLTLH